MTADLHLHSRFSDGSLSVPELAIMAQDKGIGLIAVTDHDGHAHFEACRSLDGLWGPRVIAGIEVSAWDARGGRKAHILAYGTRQGAGALAELYQATARARHRRSLESIDTLASRGLDIDARRVALASAGPLVLYKQHIMAYLVSTGQAKDAFGEEYRALFRGRGPCAGDIDYPDVHDVLEASHRDGGLAVLAHPGQTDSLDLVKELADKGLDGVEVDHPDNDRHYREALSELCRQRGLLALGGSDFHGAYGTVPYLGLCLCRDGGRSLMERLGDF